MQKKIIYLSIVIFLATAIFLKTTVYADVGDFESYSSDSWSSARDSGWSSSSDSGWSSYSSSRDYYDDDYRNSNHVTKKSDAMSFFIVLAIVLFYWFINSKKYKRRPLHTTSYYNEVQPNETEVLNKIKEIDINFNEDEFKSWVRDLFIKLQYAWSERNWETIRCFETNELFEQHSTQLKRYIENKQINKMERVSVNWVKLLRFEQSGDKEVLSIVLNSKMIDYIVDENTNNIIKGDKQTEKINNYKLTFLRTAGIKTRLGTKELKVTNCPNCGAPTEITSSGKCSYCGSIITTEEYSWVLSNLERYTNF